MFLSLGEIESNHTRKLRRMLDASEKSEWKQSFAYPTQGTARNLCKALGLSTRKAINWFRCMRTKGNKIKLSKGRKLMIHVS